MLLTSLLLLLLLQVMAMRKVKYMPITDSATAWSDHAPCFLFSNTGNNEELKKAVHAYANPQGDATLFLQDDGDVSARQRG